jgi:hypothetical protein
MKIPSLLEGMASISELFYGIRKQTSLSVYSLAINL